MNKSSMSLLIWIGLVTNALAVCDQAGRYCVYGTINEAGQNVLTIHSAAKGWTSIGIGASMLSCTEIYLIWKNPKGEIVLSPRNSSSHSMPIYNHASRSYLTNHKYQVPAWANLAASIVVPYRLNNLTRFIYASSDSPVQSPELKNSNFFKHDSKGHLSGLDFPQPSVKSIKAQSKIFDGLVAGGEEKKEKSTFLTMWDNFWKIPTPQAPQNAGMGGGVNGQQRGSQNAGMGWGVNGQQAASQNAGMGSQPPMSQNTYPPTTPSQNAPAAWGQGSTSNYQYPWGTWGYQGANYNQYTSSGWGQGSTSNYQYPWGTWGQQGATYNQYTPSAWGQGSTSNYQYPWGTWGQQGQGSYWY